MALDLSFTCVDGVAAEQSNFTVVFEPASPIEGQVVHMHITGNGGHPGVPSIETDPDLIGVVWDFDDAGNTWIGDESFLPAVKGRAQQPELGYTHITAHLWKTAGVKTVEISSFTAGGGLRVQTFKVTVASVDSLTLTKDLYIDLTGSTAGMSAEDCVVTRITSYAAIAALSGSFGASDVVRWRFRAGTTHQLDASGSGTIISLDGALHYVGSFGSGARPVIQEDAPPMRSNRFL